MQEIEEVMENVNIRKNFRKTLQTKEKVIEKIKSFKIDNKKIKTQVKDTSNRKKIIKMWKDTIKNNRYRKRREMKI